MADSTPAEPAAGRILVVEDEEAIAQGLLFNLRRKGFQVDLAVDGQEALDRAAEIDYRLIVLDVRLPKLNGFQVCQRLRQRGRRAPILMLTARDQPDDIVFGLKNGADDYMVKPFDLAEFLARVEGLIRRVEWSRAEAVAANGQNGGETDSDLEETERSERYEFGDHWIDFRTWRAQARQGVIELSRKEVEVMKIFTDRPHEVVTRRELLEKVWELPNHPNTRVVDNVIVALRKAFEENAWRPRHIHSVRGVGYRFVP